MSMCYGSLLLGLVLFSFPHRLQAEQDQHTEVAQKTVKSKRAKKLPRKKVPRKHKSARNMLHPFTLRLLYTPSYRFLTEHVRDDIEKNKEASIITEVAQFFPIAAGLEGELAFNNWVSLAIGGSFIWRGEFIVLELTAAGKEKVKKGGSMFPDYDYKYYEFVVESSLYLNVKNYFKLGAGGGLTFANTILDVAFSEEGKNYRDEGEISWKRIFAHLALRRDFFWSHGGFGMGLNASIPLLIRFNEKEKIRRYVDGKLQKKDTEIGSSSNIDNDGNDDRDFYSLMLMPMIYMAF